MKKFTFFSIVIIAVMLSSFTSCHKDGEFNPKKKIYRIYSESTGVGKELDATWTWNDNLLSRIDYKKEKFDKFEYDKKRISKIERNDGNSIGSSTTTFSYDGSKFDKIEKVHKDVVSLGAFSAIRTEHTVYQFAYKGSKVEKITVTVTTTDTMMLTLKSGVSEKVEESDFNPLQFIFSEQTCKSIAKLQSEEKSNSKGGNSYTYTISYTWDGNNIEKEVLEYKDISFTETRVYTYDNKKNPFYGLFMEAESSDISKADVSHISKNNAIKVVTSNSKGENTEVNYTYQYDGNFPVESKATNTKNSYYTTRFYEYK